MPGNPVEPVKRLLPPGVPPLTVVYVEGVKAAGGVVQWDGRRWILTDPDDLGITSSGGGGGSGTVTSVAMTVPGIFSITGSPITTSGTLALSLATQTANTVWAGPTTGSAAVPTFRALVLADVASSVLGTGTANSAKILYGDRTWGDVPSVGSVTMGVQVLASDETNSTAILSSIVALSVEDLDEDSWYMFEWMILWQSNNTGSGVVFSVFTLGANDAAQSIRAHSEVPTGPATTVTRWQTAEETSSPLTTSVSIDAANETRLAIVRALIKTGATTPNPTLIRYHGDSTHTITIKAGTSVRYTKIG